MILGRGDRWGFVEGVNNTIRVTQRCCYALGDEKPLRLCCLFPDTSLRRLGIWGLIHSWLRRVGKCALLFRRGHDDSVRHCCRVIDVLG